MAAALQRSILAFWTCWFTTNIFAKLSRTEQYTMGNDFGSLCINNHVSVRTPFRTKGIPM